MTDISSTAVDDVEAEKPVEVEAAASATMVEAAKKRSLPVRFARRQPFGAVAFTIIFLFVLMAILAPILAPYDPVAQDRRSILTGPGIGGHALGTDQLGRDVLSRIIFGARTSMLIAVSTVVVGMVIGVTIGILSGYLGGKWVDTLVQRLLEPLMAIPALVLLMFVAAILGPSILHTIMALSLLVIPSSNRIARAEMLRIREEPFVDAARVNGAGTVRILLRHGLPNLMAPLMVYGSLLFAVTIIAESSLSFLGIGPPPPNASWGGMLSQGAATMEIAPWGVLFPGVALTLAVLAFNLLGDALRDFMDPKRASR
ncbi:MAG: ABC transporter permease [Frankiaceae bacterium]|jgi:peptide/nickel transport system permease protein|nr:ABC transporter permease [Frankiaceae bacterium]